MASVPKTPALQAAEKFLEGCVPTVLAAGVIAAVPFLEGSNVNWRVAIITAAGVMAKTLFDAATTYFKAHGTAVPAPLPVVAPTATSPSTAAPVSNI